MDIPQSQEHGDEHVFHLYNQILEGKENSPHALQELSVIAMGDHKIAQRLINDIDSAVQAGKLTLPTLPIDESSPSFVNEAFFIITHPVLFLRAMRRQFAVALEIEAPPHTSTWEEFPELSTTNAAKAIRAAEQGTSGVPQNAWSQSDQELMAQGKRPKGTPEHPNI